MLDISEEQRDRIRDFRCVAARSYALTNDYWSWAKELRESNEGKQRMFNAVSIVMRKQEIPEREALEIVRNLAIHYERRLLSLRDALLSQGDNSRDFERYLDAHIWLCSGNSYWSASCDRYHS